MNALLRFLSPALATAALLASAAAQSIHPPVVSDTGSDQPGVTEARTSASRRIDLSRITSELETGLPLWRFGPFGFRPHLAYTFLHGSGILAGPGAALDTDTQTASAGLAVDIGDHWHGDYTPAWTWYSNPRFKDSFDDSASLVGSYTFDDWTVGLNTAYSSMHPVLVETASQSHETRYTFGGSAAYRLSERTEIDASASQTYRSAAAEFAQPGFEPSNSRDWSGRVGAGWHITDRTTLAPGIVFGYTTPGIGPGMVYTRPDVQVKWVPTNRLTFTAEAGAERRRFHRHDTGTLNNPVYSASARYRPFDATSLEVQGSQGISVSYLGNAVTRSRAYRAMWEQRLVGVVFATAEASRQKSSFIATEFTLPLVREDQYVAYDFRLAVPFLKHGVLSGFYRRAHNSSSLDGFGFTSRQIGMEVQYSF